MQGVRSRKVAVVAAASSASVLMGVLFVSPAAAADTGGSGWHIEAMQAEKMWEKSKGDGVTVAVLDTGVDKELPELRGRVLNGKNFFDPKRSPHSDDSGHGSTVAALIAGSGENGGIRGLAPESKILPLTVTESTEDENKDELKLKEHLDDAIDFAVKNDARIINMSFGHTEETIWNPIVQKAVDRANRAGVLLFASAGNHAKKGNKTSYPASFPGVAAVAATDEKGKVADFSTYGPYIALAAPGTDLPGVCNPGRVRCASDGTSLSTAIASASAALIWSKYPDWTANQVLRVLIETAGRDWEGDKPSKYVGYGAVRPRIALADDSIDPGDPDKNPLFSKYYAKQDEKSDSSERPDDGKSGTDVSEEDQKAQGDASEKDSNSFLVPAIAVGAVAILGTALAVVLLRRRAHAGQ